MDIPCKEPLDGVAPHFSLQKGDSGQYLYLPTSILEFYDAKILDIA